MNWQPVLVAVPTTLIAVSGWVVGHLLNSSRDRNAKRRDIRVQYLIEAYRRLQTVGNRELTDSLARDLEDALADVQLFGSPRQVALVKEVVQAMAGPERSANLDPLLLNLRDDLRRELKLSHVATAPVHLRIRP